MEPLMYGLTIFTILPLVFYLIYAFYKNKDKSFLDKNLYLILIIITMFGIILAEIFKLQEFIVVLSIPIMIALSKNYFKTSLILSLLLISYNLIFMKIFHLEIIFEYLSYFLIYLIYKFIKFKNVNLLILFVFINTLFFLKFYVIITPVFSVIEFLMYIVGKQMILLILVFMLNLIYSKSTINIEYDKILGSELVNKTLFNITHEIKNPITVCKGYISMIDFNNSAHRKYINIISEEIDRSLLLLEDFSCISNLQIKIDIMDVDLLFEDLENYYSLLFKNHNVKLEINAKQAEVMIEGDFNRLKQVMVNIIKNAIESMNKEKKIIKIYCESNNKNISIIIHDNGTGMSRNVINNVGKSFFTTKTSGTGIGMTVANKIIKAHKGKIEYESKLGEYTKCIITLPIYEF
ncbi:MAG: sensor histidine kinase [Bacilli bacterium]